MSHDQEALDLLARVIEETRDLIDHDRGSPEEGWRVNDDGDIVYPEGCEEPGWLVYHDGRRITMTWGCLTIDADVFGDDYTAAVRRLLRAAEAWNDDGVLRGDDHTDEVTP